LSALGSGFAGTAQSGAALPLIVDGLAFASLIPAAESSLYQPAPPATGLDEAAQAAAYAGAFTTASCQPNVFEVLLDSLVDGASAGTQSGLYYPDGIAKTSLQPVLQAMAATERSTRTCAAPRPSPGPKPGTTTTTSSTTSTEPSAPPVVKSVATPGALVFPSSLSASAAPSLRLGCATACLYLVTLQRSYDGTPVLATRGTLGAGKSARVVLPHVPVPAGRYRFSVWLVSRDDPGPVSVARSPVLTAS
jgi:hypothetical protein